MTTAEKLTAVAENSTRLYERGIEAVNTFWDAYQANGNRQSYANAFCGEGWSDTTFRPHHDFVGMTSTQMMFQESQIGDLVAVLDACGVTLSTAGCSNIKMMYYWCRNLTTIPVVDTTAVTDNENGLYALFANDVKLVSIEKLILKSDGSQKLPITFNSCNALEEIRFEGVIGQNIDLSASSRLSRASMLSALAALADRTGAEDTYTCTFGATNLAKLTAAEKAVAADKGWVLK